MTLTPQVGYRAWLGLGLLTLPLFVLALDASVLYLAAPHIGAALSRPPRSGCGSSTSTAS